LFLLLPAFILYSVFVAYPYVNSFLYSFTDWMGVGPKHFIGLGNYIRLFTEPRLAHTFWRALSHNVILFAVSMLFTVGLGLSFAFILSSRKLKGRGFFKVVYFLPYILPPLSMGFIWRYILHPRWGALNEALRGIGLGGWTHAWLGELGFAFPTIMAVWCLRFTGLYILFFMASMLSIPEELRDAAMVDGCNRLQTIWHIELPLLKPTILLLSLLNFINAFNAFDMVYALSDLSGSPFGQSDVSALFFYRTAFGSVNNPFGEGLGMGAAVASVMAVFLIVVSLLFLKAIQRNQVEY
jgi:raffinose/stachyose/melibiose transport system permease protein